MTVKIVFGSQDIGSQEEIDPWALISFVEARRTATVVGVEDKNITGQAAHITADVVLERGVERILLGKNWCEAWHEVYCLWMYLQGIASVWQQHDVLGRAGKTMLGNIISHAEQRAEAATYQVRRDDIDLTEAWYVEPKDGSYQQRSEKRSYFDHEPEGDEIPTDYRVDKWRPNLGTDFVQKLSAEVEAWVATRVRLPWTSLDTKSRNTSDRTGPRLVEAAVDKVANAANISRTEADAIAEAMIITFDLCPPSITKARTLTHAGAVGARHVVEHFKMHPRIDQRWHVAVAAAFLSRWQANTKTLASKSSTPGLNALVTGWSEVTTVYNELVSQFGKAALA